MSANCDVLLMMYLNGTLVTCGSLVVWFIKTNTMAELEICLQGLGWSYYSLNINNCTRICKSLCNWLNLQIPPSLYCIMPDVCLLSLIHVQLCFFSKLRLWMDLKFWASLLEKQRRTWEICLLTLKMSRRHEVSYLISHIFVYQTIFIFFFSVRWSEWPPCYYIWWNWCHLQGEVLFLLV